MLPAACVRIMGTRAGPRWPDRGGADPSRSGPVLSNAERHCLPGIGADLCASDQEYRDTALKAFAVTELVGEPVRQRWLMDGPTDRLACRNDLPSVVFPRALNPCPL